MEKAPSENSQKSSGDFLSKLTASQKHELVGRALQLQDEERWQQLLESTTERRTERTISFRTLNGEGCELQLAPMQTIASVKLRVLQELEPSLPAIEAGTRRQVKLLHSHEVLCDDLIVALVPDELTVVFNIIELPTPRATGSSSSYENPVEWDWDHSEDSDRYSVYGSDDS
ncbi:unnamed protein product [Symbiodinium natans]|uniref:Ubiquitin-like domain-containing protein n=1 Tax=Symbiodinium natans TaxID=878477 RepID=A0A812N6X3_9DINO|nr:unnamed protein product [Symbiodinium natans]